MALFLGASLGPDVYNHKEAAKNRFIITQFSKPIARVNFQFFYDKLEEKMAKEYFELI